MLLQASPSLSLNHCKQAEESSCRRGGSQEGMEWSRGEVVGRGSFATVSLASVLRCDPHRHRLPSLMAVKSAPLSSSALLSHEESVLSELAGCPHLVRCLGHDVTADPATGAASYDLFLEYVPGGTLRDALRLSGGSLPEPAVRRYARSILLALCHVHALGYAHCDVKLENVLLDGAVAKLADFGLAKKVDCGGGGDRCAGIRGTPLYMSPEAVARGEYGAAADVWSLGCAVAEMATGRPAWGRSSDSGDGAAWGLLFKIGFSDESPEIPVELSEKGKDFLRRCFVKDPARRWTVEMLLQHPFMALEEDAVGDGAMDGDRCSSTWSSPRSVLGLTQWLSPRSQSSSICSSSLMESVADPDSSRAIERIGELATTNSPNWSSSSSSIDGWIDVRMISEMDSKSEEEPMLEKMVRGNGSRDGILESNKDGSCRPVAIQLSLPILATKHEDSTKPVADAASSLDQTGVDLDRSSFYSLTEKECKKVETTFKQYKHTEF